MSGVLIAGIALAATVLVSVLLPTLGLARTAAHSDQSSVLQPGSGWRASALTELPSAAALSQASTTAPPQYVDPKICRPQRSP
jgi:hypothetical protein